MNDIKLYNTHTRAKEDFRPIESGKVGIYHCGPTVYDYAHIGNLRAYIFADILRRAFEYNGYEVNQVMNITDVGQLASDADDGEDKMTKALKREGKPMTLEAMKEVADFYTDQFRSNLNELNIRTPHVLPKASEHIPEQIDLIKKLEEKDVIYKTSDGVYFDTSKDEHYGELARLDVEKLKEGARVEANKEKKNPADFALWKFTIRTDGSKDSTSNGTSNSELGWDSPWGKGFPGWHLECSAMSMKYLGSHFDIHTGGIDHIPVHHVNEIVQSEMATSEKFVNVWMHNEFVDVSGEKMAKSAGNFITLKTLVEKNHNPLAYRYWILTAHYRRKVDFIFEALDGAEVALKKLHSQLSGVEIGTINEEYKQKFAEYINDDLNTPKAIALLWELIKDENVSDEDRAATAEEFDKVLGLNLTKQEKAEISDEVIALADEREKYRKDKEWEKSDKLRKKIEEMGYEIKDTDNGYDIVKNRCL